MVMAISNSAESQVFRVEKTLEQVKLIKLSYLFENDMDANTYIGKRMEQFAIESMLGYPEFLDPMELLSAFMQKAMPWVLHDPMCPVTEIRMAMGLTCDQFARKVHIMYKSIWNPDYYVKSSISIGS